MIEPVANLFLTYSSELSFLAPAFLWAGCYQVLCNVRHVLWDFNIGIDIKMVRVSGYLIVLLSFIMTGALWLLI